MQSPSAEPPGNILQPRMHAVLSLPHGNPSIRNATTDHEKIVAAPLNEQSPRLRRPKKCVPTSPRGWTPLFFPTKMVAQANRESRYQSLPGESPLPDLLFRKAPGPPVPSPRTGKNENRPKTARSSKRHQSPALGSVFVRPGAALLVVAGVPVPLFFFGFQSARPPVERGSGPMSGGNRLEATENLSRTWSRLLGGNFPPWRQGGTDPCSTKESKPNVSDHGLPG